LPEIPEMPEPENRIVKNHLFQALNSLSTSPEPIKNFQIFFNEQTNNSLSPSATAAQIPRPNENLQDLISKSFNPLIYGNDVDSVDIATRITLVQFLISSKNLLLNFNEHTRTLRLYPRPVVAFQYNSFLRSRPVKSTFIIKLAKTQAVEYLAEWSLCPTNVAYLRIQTGIFDPSLIGDKAKWYCRYLTPIQFRVYNEKISLLSDTLLSLNEKPIKTDEMNEDSETPTDESGASGSSDFEISNIKEDENEDAKKQNTKIIMVPQEQLNTMCVDVKAVYRPPNKFINSEDENDVDTRRSLRQNRNINCSYESSFTTSSSSSSVGDLFTNDNTNQSPVRNKPIHQNESSSTSATPVNKNFTGFTVFDVTDEKKRTFSSSTGKESMTRTPNSVNSLNKTKQSSLISQISDEISDVANKAAKKVSELVNEQPTVTANNRTGLPKLNSVDINTSNLTHSISNLTPLSTPTPTNTPRQNHQQIQLEHQQQQMQMSSVNDMNNENQQFLKEVLNGVLEGHGIGWLKINRIKRLMEDENYRNFVLSRLNKSLDKKFSNDEEHIEDIRLTRQVFKGMAKLIQTIVYGLEQTYANNGIGGMASAYQLFEIIHTHYWINDNTGNTSSKNNENSSPNTLSSPSMPSPLESKENLSSIQSTYNLSKLQQQQQQQHEMNNRHSSPHDNNSTSLVTQLGNLWNNSKLNSFTKSLSSHINSSSKNIPTNKNTTIHISPTIDIENNNYKKNQNYFQYQIPYFNNNEATNPLYEETNNHEHSGSCI
jgi:hypothetical protein